MEEVSVGAAASPNPSFTPVPDTGLPGGENDPVSDITETSPNGSDPPEMQAPQPSQRSHMGTVRKLAREAANAASDAQKMLRLRFLLERSSIYSKFLTEKLEALHREKRVAAGIATPTATPAKRVKRAPSKAKSGKLQGDVLPGQPKLLTGAVLRDYQVDGVQWLISLYENGLNGILADEMGLGKTIQTIGFLAHLVEQGVEGPFLVVVPLAVLFYGTKEERAVLRKHHYAEKVPDFMVTITSYEVAMRERPLLQRFAWKYLVVDEGHRLRNFDCKLFQELKKVGAMNRLLLTGTPLHNNLGELWALLNFILPDVFDDLTSFIGCRGMDDEQRKSVIQQLHQILKPFLLRRLKVDVEHSLPKKREYILNAHLTVEQKKLYDVILEGKLREHLIGLELNNAATQPTPKSTYKTTYRYINDGDDIEEVVTEIPFDPMQAANKKVSDLRLQNMVMQLRKACNHPLLFNAPYDPVTGEYIYDPRAVLNSSGKMLLLDKLLHELIAKDHRILIFSQFTQIVDIIESYLLHLRKWEFCRIDGTVKQDSRQQQIHHFNSNPDIKVFLISTRAGGLGINLATADTVIFYDSDWNPQMDLQAQDRCHRIGQKKPVIVYRLITANTIEAHLINRANSKRLLEKLVIHKSKFKSLRSSKHDEELYAELDELVYNRDYEDIIVKPGDELITASDLARIMDRSDGAYEQAALLLSAQESQRQEPAASFRLFQTLQTEENQFSLQDSPSTP
ncbi:putative ATPase [Massospora cicadina]|nr:putative ATPase [Massospora cicadina]